MWEAWWLMITYSLGFALWTVNLILDNKGGKIHMIFLYFSQVHLLIVPISTIIADIIAVSSYGTRLEALYSWTGNVSPLSTGLDATSALAITTRTA